MELIKKELNIDIKEFNESEGTLRAVVSSGMPDRQGEMIDQSSWKLDEFKTNPVVLWAHDHSKPAIGQALSIGINSDGMLEAVVKFAVKEYDFAKTIFKLYAGKFMRQFSVGFLNEESEEVNDIRILKNNILYEFSAVNVGADALALAKSKGIDITPLEEKKAKIPHKSPACRMDNESHDKCVERKVPEIMKENEGMKRNQAVAIAHALCNKKCKSIEKEGRVLSAKNRAIIEKAKFALDDVLKADVKKETPKYNQLNYRRILNKAIRELVKARQ
jgi:hypothetical protein